VVEAWGIPFGFRDVHGFFGGILENRSEDLGAGRYLSMPGWSGDLCFEAKQLDRLLDGAYEFPLELPKKLVFSK